MRVSILMATVVLGAIVALAACNATDNAGATATTNTAKTSASPTATAQASPAATAQATPDAHGHSDQGRRITVQEARKLMDEGKAFIVDVRNQQSYEAGHIKGAVLIPEEQIVARSGELPRDKTIITYCA